METLTLFTKRSLALDFFRKHYNKRTRGYISSLVYLILTPKKELGWVAKSPETGKYFFSKKREQEVEIENLDNCQIISPESIFLYKEKVYWYRFNKVTKDYNIVFVKMVDSITFAERLYPDTEFKFCLMKNGNNNIINCAWVAYENGIITKQIPVFQDEPSYKGKDISFEPINMGDEFFFMNRRWYTCTEKGKCLLAELPVISHVPNF